MDGTRSGDDGAPLEFVFTLTRSEHLHAFDDLHPLHWWQLVPWITAPGGHATRRAALWLAGAFLIVLGVPLLFVRAFPRVGLIGPFLIAIAWFWLMLLRALRRRAAAATYDRQPVLQREQRWRLTDESLVIDYGERMAKIAWRDVMRVEETRDGFGFVVSLERTGFLPWRAIEEARRPRVRALLAAVTAGHGTPASG